MNMWYNGIMNEHEEKELNDTVFYRMAASDLPPEIRNIGEKVANGIPLSPRERGILWRWRKEKGRGFKEKWGLDEWGSGK